jgi:hypothetical protein
VCSPFFVVHWVGCPFSIFCISVGRLNTIESRTLFQSLYIV